MTAAERQEIKTAIDHKIKTTEEAIAEYKEMTKPVAPDVAIGRISRMDAINNKSVMEAALREADAKLTTKILASAQNAKEKFRLAV